MSEITHKDYWKEVADLAAFVVAEAKHRGVDVSEVIHETVDGHRWVIYTAYHHYILQQTDQDVAERFSDIGGPDTTQDWDHMVMQAAYLALQGDVSDAAYELGKEKE